MDTKEGIPQEIPILSQHERVRNYHRHTRTNSAASQLADSISENFLMKAAADVSSDNDHKYASMIADGGLTIRFNRGSKNDDMMNSNNNNNNNNQLNDVSNASNANTNAQPANLLAPGSTFFVFPGSDTADRDDDDDGNNDEDHQHENKKTAKAKEKKSVTKPRFPSFRLTRGGSSSNVNDANGNSSSSPSPESSPSRPKHERVSSMSNIFRSNKTTSSASSSSSQTVVSNASATSPTIGNGSTVTKPSRLRSKVSSKETMNVNDNDNESEENERKNSNNEANNEGMVKPSSFISINSGDMSQSQLELLQRDPLIDDPKLNNAFPSLMSIPTTVQDDDESNSNNIGNTNKLEISASASVSSSLAPIETNSASNTLPVSPLQEKRTSLNTNAKRNSSKFGSAQSPSSQTDSKEEASKPKRASLISRFSFANSKLGKRGSASSAADDARKSITSENMLTPKTAALIPPPPGNEDSSLGESIPLSPNSASLVPPPPIDDNTGINQLLDSFTPVEEEIIIEDSSSQFNSPMKHSRDNSSTGNLSHLLSQTKELETGVTASPITTIRKKPELPPRKSAPGPPIEKSGAAADDDFIPPPPSPPPLEEEQQKLVQNIGEDLNTGDSAHHRIPTIVNEFPSSQIVENPKEILRQRAESVTNRFSVRRASRAIQHQQPTIASASASNTTTGTRRPTLLDLQAKLAELKDEQNGVKSLAAQNEEEDEEKQEIIEPTLLTSKVAINGVANSSQATATANARPNTLSRGASGNMTRVASATLTRPASGSVSSMSSDIADEACDENDYVRCVSLLGVSPFQGRTFTASIEPNQVAALIENSLTSVTSLNRATTFRPQVGDVIVASPPRCGQTPILQILDTLLLQDNVDNVRTIEQAEQARMPTTIDEINDILDTSLVGAVDSSLLPLPFRAPWLESILFDGCGVDVFGQRKDGRRVFKTHMGCAALRSGIKSGVKYIIVARDPIDVRLSHFRYIRKLYRKSEAEDARPFDDEYTLDSFARVPVTPCRINRTAMATSMDTVTVTKTQLRNLHNEHDQDDGGFEADLAAWVKTKDQYPANVLIVFYEEVCSQPMKAVTRIAEFLEMPGKAPIPRKRIEAAVKRLMKSPLFPSKTITKCLNLVATKKTKVQLRIEELERKERATLGVRKIEQEEEPDPNKRQHKRNLSTQKMDTNGNPDDRTSRRLFGTSTGAASSNTRPRSESGGYHARTRSRGASSTDEFVAGRARGDSVDASQSNGTFAGCIQLGHRLFDDLDIEWLDDAWNIHVRARIPAAISYEHLFLKHMGQNFPFGQRDRPKNVLMERAKSQQLSEQKSKGVVRRVSSLFVGGA